MSELELQILNDNVDVSSNIETEVVVEIVDTVVDVAPYEPDTTVILGSSGPQGPRGSSILVGDGAPSPVVGLINDVYLDKSAGLLYGPKTAGGWGTGYVMGTGLALDDVAYTHIQSTAAQTWTITHPLQFTPNIIVVSLVSGTQQEVIGDYEYNGNTIIATFSQPIVGAAYLS